MSIPTKNVNTMAREIADITLKGVHLYTQVEETRNTLPALAMGIPATISSVSGGSNERYVMKPGDYSTLTIPNHLEDDK
jgi:hypothetical protein